MLDDERERRKLIWPDPELLFIQELPPSSWSSFPESTRNVCFGRPFKMSGLSPSDEAERVLFLEPWFETGRPSVQRQEC